LAVVQTLVWAAGIQTIGQPAKLKQADS